MLYFFTLSTYSNLRKQLLYTKVYFDKFWLPYPSDKDNPGVCREMVLDHHRSHTLCGIVKTIVYIQVKLRVKVNKGSSYKTLIFLLSRAKVNYSNFLKCRNKPKKS